MDSPRQSSARYSRNPQFSQRMRAIARKVVFLGAALFCLTRWVSPLVAIALGATLSLTINNPYPKVGQKLSEWILEVSVILLGFGMSLPIVLKVMAAGALFSSAVILGGLLLGLLLGKLLRIGVKESVLISAGSAICGGTAIVAVGSAVGAEEEDVTIAIGTVLLLNTAALYLFPAVGHTLQLNQQQFGIWAGVAIHDVSSVVASAESYGPAAMQVALAVKLTRVVWIIPIAFFLRWAMNRRPMAAASPDVQAGHRPSIKIHVPWYIGIFLLSCVVREFVPGVAIAGPLLTRLGIAGLTLTFFLMGAGVSRKSLKALSWKPLTQGILLWLVISLASLFSILRWNAGYSW